MRTFGKAIGCTLVYLVVFFIVGSIFSLVIDFFSDVVGSIPFRRSNASPAAFYAIWFVAGVYCGLLNFQSAGAILSSTEPANPPGENRSPDWTSRPNAGKAGLLVILATCVVFMALLIPFLVTSSLDEVLDGTSLTLTYLGSVLASEIFFLYSLRSKPKKSA